MIRTGEDYKASIRESRDVYMNGERVKDVTTHPMFKPLVDIRARIYDLQHDPLTRHLMTYQEDGETHAINNKLPLSQQDWWDKRRATDTVLEDIGGVVTRVGDETVGEMWSLFDGQEVLNEVDPQFSKNIRDHILRVVHTDPFHVSANTDPKGDRSKAPQDKDPDMLIGPALFSVRQTGLEKQQAVQEKLTQLAVYREGINAHLTAAIALPERSPGGLMMPNQSLLYAGRVLACSQLHQMMHIARELCGGQICVTPDKAAFENAETKPWLEKFYTINERWGAEDRRRLLSFARDLVNSDYAGHRLTFQLLAQSSPFAHLAAVYRNFDWEGPLAFVRKSAGLSERVLGKTAASGIDKAPDQWTAARAMKAAG